MQGKVIEALAASPLREQFYWTGGTALAVVYLHHRKSEDLDFFSDEPVPSEGITQFIEGLRKSIPLESVETRKIFDRREFFLHNHEEVRLEFVHYDHPQIHPHAEWQGIFVDSLEDIAVNKVMSLVDRNEPKDVFDLYFLLTQSGYEVAALLPQVEKKFGVRLEESMIWSEALTRANALDALRPLMTSEEARQDEEIRSIRRYFEEGSKRFLRQTLE